MSEDPRDKRIAQLEARIVQLEKENEELKKENEELRREIQKLREIINPPSVSRRPYLRPLRTMKPKKKADSPARQVGPHPSFLVRGIKLKTSPSEK